MQLACALNARMLNSSRKCQSRSDQNQKTLIGVHGEEPKMERCVDAVCAIVSKSSETFNN